MIESERSTVEPTSPETTRGPGRKAFLAYSKLIPALLGTILYLLNNLDVIHSLLFSPAGYVPLGVQRNNDIAMYLTWLNGFSRAWLIPNFHAAWYTPHDFVVLPLIPVSAMQRSLSLSPAWAFQTFSLFAYVFTAYAVAFALKTFCESRRQATAALLLAFACVPVSSLPFVHLLGHHKSPEDIPGRFAFLTVSDGFFHGLITMPLMTLGTGFQVLSMALLARYSESRERRWLGWLALTCFFSALVHPFEIVVTVVTAGVVLLRRFDFQGVRSALLIAIAGGAGLAPHILQTLRVPWVHEVAELNRATLGVTPGVLFVMVGLPAMFVMALLFLGLPHNPKGKFLVLQMWCVVGFVLVFAPSMPFPIHFLDGWFVVVGLLLTTQLRELACRWPAARLPAVRVAAVIFLGASLIPHVVFRLRAWDAPATGSDTFVAPSAALAPLAEVHATEWLRDHASWDDLVLTNHDSAPWIAMAPTHSFASHWLCSLLMTHPNYSAVQNAFFAGTLSSVQGHEFLERFGFRFVFAPDGSPGLQYLDRAIPRAHFDNWSIYEIPGARMKPYHASDIVDSF